MKVIDYQRPSLMLGLIGALAIGVGFAQAEESSSDDSRHWAFEPVQSVQPPSEPDPSGWANNPIDRFVLARLKEKGLQPNSPADRSTLIRRAYFDLIGLPPTPEQVEAFLQDNSPDAYAKVIDRLLASEHYGERWGRHWLDLARYADTSGDGADAPIPEAHLYRDYVIDSFNQDLPYDEFILEQIAGDLLAKKHPDTRARERTIATGYIALARRFGNAPYADMHLVIENTLSTIGKGMLGMTVGCARCHDHKFDPISMQDYYGLYGYFSSTQYPHPSTEHERQRKNFVDLPGGGVAYAVVDKDQSKEIGDAPIHRNGNPRSKAKATPRGFLDVIKDRDAEIPDGESGRLQLAEWIASPDNPLTARVMVNRVWQYHFGKGIVATSSNFGRQGEPPTHPRLLDWLAAEFVRHDWSVKHLHRVILNSRIYQLSSEVTEASLEKDPVNKWYWRYPRQRLEAEPIRDAVLFVSGRLHQGNPGAPPYPEPNEENKYNYTQHRPFEKDYTYDYRTVYLPSRRLGKHPYMEIFDGPNPNECTAQREVSTVPLQSLFWMNSDFIKENAQSLAQRLIRETDNPADRIELGYQLAFGRPPTEREIAEALDYIDDYIEDLPQEASGSKDNRRAWTSFSRILFASNEFVYLD